VLRKVQQVHPSTKVIMLTNHATERYRRECQKAGVITFSISPASSSSCWTEWQLMGTSKAPASELRERSAGSHVPAGCFNTIVSDVSYRVISVILR
jgi:DNA-binding NarL/FixJ family response regulator